MSWSFFLNIVSHLQTGTRGCKTLSLQLVEQSWRISATAELFELHQNETGNKNKDREGHRKGMEEQKINQI